MDNLFQNIGLFLCVGGLIVVALIAFAVASFTRRARKDTQTPSVFNERGRERPQYDSQRVESRGGFGGNVDTDRRGSSIPQTGRRSGSGFGGGARTFDRNPDVDRNRRRQDDDDDNIRSSGGFGG